MTACRPKPPTGQTPKAQPKSITGTIMELMKENKPLKCKYKKYFKDESFEGVIYINGDQIRNEITVPNNNGIIRKSIGIVSEGIEYVWFEGDTKGMKINRKEETPETSMEIATENLSEEEILAQAEGVAEEYGYGCEAWQPDNFYFDLPTDVQFYDYEYLREGLEKALCNKCREETNPLNRSVCISNLGITCN